MKLSLELGLQSFQLRAKVSQDASEKGFSNQDDTYIWGILAIQCDSASRNVVRTSCERLESITLLGGTMYVMLSATSLLITFTLAMLVVTMSPLLHIWPTMALYTLALVFYLVSLMIYELRLMHLFEDPNAWAIHPIRTNLAGIDRPFSIPPQSVNFLFSNRRISRILAWVGFGSLLTSFVLYTVRVRHTSRSKKYLSTLNTVFVSRKSVLVNVAKTASRNDLSSIRPKAEYLSL